MDTQKPIAIIGAGIAGLTAANYLRQNNVRFILFEGSDKIAGLAKSYTDAEGFSNDFGAHFVTNRLANAIGVGSECRTVKHYGEAVWLKGKSYNYPIGLMTIPRMLRSYISTKINTFNKNHSVTAAEWYSKRYGDTLAKEVALPLLEAWSGIPAEELSPAVGESMPVNIFNTVYLKAASLLTGRAVGCGYSREMPEKPSVYHVYPNNGVSTLCEKLSEGLEDSIRLKSFVKEIFIENEKVRAVRANGKIQEVAAVISTAPANILAKIVTGTDALKAISEFRYRPMVFVNMRFEGQNHLPDTVLWFPEEDFPFFRLTEVTRSMPWLAPKGKSIITADIGCQIEDEFWSMSEASLIKLCLDNILPLIPDAKERFLGGTVLRTPIAYPVFHIGYERERQDFEQSTNIGNLLSVGRNGEFAHLFMEDVYWRTRKKVEKLVIGH